ncbi:hypothetical protein D1O36_00650 [Streptococcus thermophilus]|nr:hypothetical protein D1O36_00650 [Streptococcus thermophilus]PJH78960.1 hypothetical protein CV716_06780 [Streptococcus thermophilus]
MHVWLNVRNQVLRKLVKLHNSQNVNQYDYINVSRHSRVISWVSFFIQNSIVSTKVSTNFPPLFFQATKCNIAYCPINYIFCIYISLCNLLITMS